MTAAFNWRRPTAALLGVENYAALHAIRQARLNRLTEQADDARRAALYRRWVGPGDLVLDIGANLGNRTRVFAGLGARVVAVEPQAHCRAALRWQFLFQRRVRIVPAAAGRDNTPQRIVQFETDVLSSMNPDWIAAARQSGRFGELCPVREVTVPCVTLDQLIAEHGRPAFTKIDVEGYEAEVLAGLAQPAGTLSYEVTPELPAAAAVCLQRLAALGYRRFQLSAGESMELGDAWLDAGALQRRLDQLAEGANDFADVYALDPRLAG
ncbi:MAG: FkbM family methyltransferase [Lacunisphaera sp.]|nr:FkbM family methyltransferase [Lacunisphaera sp.]